MYCSLLNWQNNELCAVSFSDGALQRDMICVQDSLCPLVILLGWLFGLQDTWLFDDGSMIGAHYITPELTLYYLESSVMQQ